MDSTAIVLIQAGSMVSTFTFVFSRGLVTRMADPKFLASRPGLLLRSLLSVDLLVPLITLVILILLQPARDVAVGLLLLASSPAAPMVLKNIAKAEGNPEYAVSLQVALALLAIVTVPASIDLISYATGVPADVSPQAVIELVGITILLPIIAGMISAWLFPAMARHISHSLEIFSNIVLLLAVILLLFSTYHLLLSLDFMSYVAIALVTIISLGAGHLMAWGQPAEQTTLALETATRNIGLTLLIASTFTNLEKALPALIPYAITSAIICMIYARYRKRALHCHGAEGQV